jgi:hypothetical protein
MAALERINLQLNSNVKGRTVTNNGSDPMRRCHISSQVFGAAASVVLLRVRGDGELWQGIPSNQFRQRGQANNSVKSSGRRKRMMEQMKRTKEKERTRGHLEKPVAEGQDVNCCRWPHFSIDQHSVERLMTAPSAASSRQVKINGKWLEPKGGGNWRKGRHIGLLSGCQTGREEEAMKYFVLFLQNRLMFALYFSSALDGSLVKEIFPFFLCGGGFISAQLPFFRAQR